jgi:S-adenosyl-L-methionine methyltransferase
MAFEQRAMTRVRRLILAALGFLQFYYLLARYGPYRGGGEVRKRWQTGNQALRAYLNFERSYKKPVLDDYVFALTEAANERPSAAALAQYTDDSLANYGDEGGDTIVAQQRGLILPLVERAIAETTGAIIEIGTGNGDVVAHLAERYRGRTFIGIDFSTATAERKWKQPNVKFIAGYARDVIGEVSNALEIGVIFASSTFVLFNPAGPYESLCGSARCANRLERAALVRPLGYERWRRLYAHGSGSMVPSLSPVSEGCRLSNRRL